MPRNQGIPRSTGIPRTWGIAPFFSAAGQVSDRAGHGNPPGFLAGWVRRLAVLEATQNDRGTLSRRIDRESYLIYLGPHTEIVTGPPTPKPMDSDDAAPRDYDRAKRRRLGCGVGGFPAKASVGSSTPDWAGRRARAKLSATGKLATRPTGTPPGAGLPGRQTDSSPMTPRAGARIRPKTSGLPESPNPCRPLERRAPLRPKPTGPERLASLGHDPNPNERRPDAGPVACPQASRAGGAASKAPQAERWVACRSPEAASVDAAGVGHFVVKDSWWQN